MISCGSDETPYSYLSRPDADAETIDIKLNVLDDNSNFQYLLQANEMYIVWGNGTKDTEYISPSQDSINVLRSIKKTYTLSGNYDVRIKSIGLKKLDISKLDTKIIDANKGNTISALALTNCEDIIDLRFANQPISAVDLSDCPTLKTLYCGYSEGIQTITGLDKLKDLELLSVNGSLSQVTLNFTANDSLKDISIARTNCEAIIVDGLVALKSIALKNNTMLGESALNVLFTTLPVVTGNGYTISLSGNKGDDLCNKSIATQKGWTFK